MMDFAMACREGKTPRAVFSAPPPSKTLLGEFAEQILGSVLVLFVLLFAANPAAQAQGGVISDNEVNAIAKKMYCPVCENIPLDECQTRACIEWKEEIRLQLAQGKDEQAVINSFVRRFGDQVVGIPQDPVLRGLTVLTPVLALFLVIALGVHTFSRFGAHGRLDISGEADRSAAITDDVYRQRLEEDLAARR